MSIFRIGLVSCVLVLSACGGNEHQKVVYRGPVLITGFFEATESSEAVLPLLAIEVGSAGTTSYQVAFADCSDRDKTELVMSTDFVSKTSFDTKSFALLGGTTEVGGADGQVCDYHITIMAHDGNLPKAAVLDQRLEGFTSGYNYKSIAKSQFLEKLKALYAESPSAKVDESFCTALFDKECADLGLAIK